MKKLLVLLVSLVAGIEGADAQSMLRVSLKDNTQKITVAVDGRFFNKWGTAITVGDLPYGTHSLQIYGLRYNRRGKPKEDVIYDADVKTYNGMVTMVVFDPASGNQDLQEMEISAYTANHPVPAQQQQNMQGGNNYDNGNYQNNYQGNAGGNDNADNTSGGPVASPVAQEKLGTWTNAENEALKKKVAAKATDMQKMTLLKEELKKEKITTAQVGDMMDWFTFETSKVEFAKWAYSITADKEYYSDLESKFTYKNYQDEMDQFIKSQH